MDCLFCKIVSGEIPCKKVFESDEFLAFLDIDPKRVGHTLIIPKKHYKDVLEVNSNILSEVKDIVDTIYFDYEKIDLINGFELITNVGSFQDVKHLHFHFIPRFENLKSIGVDEFYNITKKN